MKRKMALTLATLSIILVLTTTMGPTTAIVYKAGISPSSSVYSETFSPSISTTENKLVITVYNVAGTIVYENITYFLSNGALNRKLSLAVDVAANSYFGIESIIAANLTTGDLLYASGAKINDSSSMIVAGANRTINHFKQNPAFNASVGGYYLEDWWDKATGITVKFNLWFPGSPGAWQNITMVSTTAWSPSPPAAPSAFSTTSILAIGVVGIVALVIGFLAGRRGKRKR